ncbi:hypothetical protein W02_41110 [Nitrospira sp. KM1]|nr:hypothetical protein W02_41110 [Nitrospira sp. KM1]
MVPEINPIGTVAQTNTIPATMLFRLGLEYVEFAFMPHPPKITSMHVSLEN